MRNYKKEYSKNQHQQAFSTVMSMIFIMGAVVVMSFVVEFGRMILVSTQTENGVSLAVEAGVFQFGKTLEERTKEEYDKAYKDAEKEVDDEIQAGTLILTEDEREKEIKKRTREELKKKKQQIKNDAIDQCEKKARDILGANGVKEETMHCTESMVTITGKRDYIGIFKDVNVGNAVFKRTEKQAISFKKE